MTSVINHQTIFCVWTETGRGSSFLTASWTQDTVLSSIVKDPIWRWFMSDVDLIFRDVLIVSGKISHPCCGNNQYFYIIHRELSPLNTVL